MVALMLTKMCGTNISRNVKEMSRNRGKGVSDSLNKRKRRIEVSLERAMKRKKKKLVKGTNHNQNLRSIRDVICSRVKFLQLKAWLRTKKSSF
jgi:translation initiation factor 2 alpha subunit (eIF-2alpha)